MATYFDEQGLPTPEAAPFFTSDGEGNAVWEARYSAVAAAVRDFEGDLITESLIKGWTVAETIAQGREDEDDHDEAMRALASDWEFRIGRDMSMNY